MKSHLWLILLEIIEPLHWHKFIREFHIGVARLTISILANTLIICYFSIDKCGKPTDITYPVVAVFFLKIDYL